jgi:hypothetical protein
VCRDRLESRHVVLVNGEELPEFLAQNALSLIDSHCAPLVCLTDL